MRVKSIALVLVVLALVAGTACRGKKQPPVARPTPPPPASEPSTAQRPPAPPEPSQEPTIPAEPKVDEAHLTAKDLDTLNRESPFQPVFFGFDSAELDASGQSTLNQNAELL